MKFVQINSNGEMNDCDEKISTRNIKSVFKRLSSCKHIHLLYTWSYDDLVISCYGNIKGSDGEENKHGLPPNGNIKEKTLDNSDIQLLFNDIFIIGKKDKLFIDFDTSDYSLFYSVCFEEYYTDEETEESNDFINDEEETIPDIENINDGETNIEESNEIGTSDEILSEDPELYDSDEDLDEDMSNY